MPKEKAKRDFKPKNRPRKPLHLLLLTMIMGSFIVIIIAFGLSIWLKTDPFTPACAMSEHLQYAYTFHQQLVIHTLDNEQPIVMDLNDPQYLQWLADGTQLGLVDFQQSYPSGNGNFMIVDTQGNVLHQFEWDFRGFFKWEASLDFRYFAFNYRDEQDRWHLMLWDLESDTKTELLPESAESQPEFAWSPDGTRLLYNYPIIHDVPNSQVLLLDASTGSVQPVFEDTHLFQLPYWVDDNTLLYQDDRVIYLHDLESTESDLLVPNGLYTPRHFSPNNRYFLYRSNDLMSIIDLQSRGRYTHRIGTTGQYSAGLTWLPQSSSLSAMHDTRNLDSIYRLDIESGEVEYLAESQYLMEFQWSPDERYLFYTVGIDHDPNPTQGSIQPGLFYILDTDTSERIEFNPIEGKLNAFRQLPNNEMGFVYDTEPNPALQQPVRFYVRNLATDAVCQLSTIPAHYSSFQWRPVGDE